MKESEQQQIFTQWLRQYKGLLFKVVRAYAFTAFDRDDLFQEISVQVWHSIPRFRHESAVSTWLYRISINTALRWVTRERKFSRHHETLERLPGTHEMLLEENQVVDEKLRWLYQEIARLKEIDRSIALLLLDGLSYQEMADMLGLTETNIGVRVYRIKQALMKKSEKYDYHGI